MRQWINFKCFHCEWIRISAEPICSRPPILDCPQFIEKKLYRKSDGSLQTAAKVDPAAQKHFLKGGIK